MVPLPWRFGLKMQMAQAEGGRETALALVVCHLSSKTLATFGYYPLFRSFWAS